MAQEKVLKLEQLERYHGKNVALMDEKDTKILADAKLYADGLGDNYDPAGTAQTKVDALETVVSGVSGKANANETAISTLNETTSTHAEKITALEEKVGEGWVAITDVEIDALFE